MQNKNPSEDQVLTHGGGIIEKTIAAKCHDDGICSRALTLNVRGQSVGPRRFFTTTEYSWARESTAGLVLGEIVELHGRIARQATVNLLTRHPRHLWNSEDSPPRQVRENCVGADWGPDSGRNRHPQCFFRRVGHNN